MKMCRTGSRRRGFSVTEVIVVMALTAIIMAIGIPYFRYNQAMRDIDSGARQFGNLLVYTRQTAVTRGGATVTFTTTTPTLICATMSASLGSVGGFCVSDTPVAAHQRLSSTAYCFSAALPPFNATAASAALKIIRSESGRLEALRLNATNLHRYLLDPAMGGVGVSQAAAGDCPLWLMGDEISPVKHLYLTNGTDQRQLDEALLNQICEHVLREAGCLLAVADYSPLQKRAPRPSIRLTVCALHSSEQLERGAAASGKAAATVLRAA